MEPAKASVVYTIETSITGIFRRGDNWFVQFNDLLLSICLGQEEPEFYVGDRVLIQLRKAYAKHSGTPIEQSSESLADR